MFSLEEFCRGLWEGTVPSLTPTCPEFWLLLLWKGHCCPTGLERQRLVLLHPVHPSALREPSGEAAPVPFGPSAP